jgi:DNA-binding NarL/FixJ family response regulator
MFIRILIADDSAIARMGLKTLLCRVQQWEVCGEAENGSEAVTETAKSHPDIVVLDLSMPVMDGLQAAHDIHELHPKLPILIYTLHTSPQLDLKAREAGARQVISKSRPDELLTAVRDALVKYPVPKPTRPALA